MTPHVTVNYGARWEPDLPTVDKQCRGNQFQMAGFLSNTHSTQWPTAPAGLFFGNDAQNPNGCPFADTHWLTMSPRLGLVWDPTGTGKQTIRLGAAIMHDTNELYYPERWTTNPPYASSVSLGQGKGIGANGAAGIAGPFSNPWLGVPGGDPFPSIGSFPASSTYISVPSHLPPSYMIQYNLSYQRQFGKDWLASVTYVGNHSVHLYGQHDLNMSQPSPTASTSNEPARRLLTLLNPTQGPFYTNVFETDPGGTAFYNAILAKLEKRLANRYTILGNYTYSHCMSNVDFTGELTTTASYQNQNWRMGESSNCASDRRHIFNLSLSASSGGLGQGFMKLLTKDWTVSPIVTLQTGQPLSITDGADISFSGEGTSAERPNVVPNVPLQLGNAGLAADSAPQWFNPSAFAGSCALAAYKGNQYCQTPGTFGSATRNIIHGPGTIQWDMALGRQFSMRERFKMDLRAEFFNFMNHANWSNPATAITSATFGQVTTFGSPRVIQMALKFRF
jgi:hypothetical protein